MPNWNQLNPSRMFNPGVIAGAPWQGDQGLTENHLRGRRIVIPAGSTLEQIMGVVDAANIHRWRVNLGCQLPPGTAFPAVPPGYHLQFRIEPSVESDEIPRLVTVPLTGAYSTFVNGRSLRILVTNDSPVDLEAHYAIDDQFTAAPTAWSDYEGFFPLAGVEWLSIPPFAQSMVFLMPVGGSVDLTGTNSAGANVYFETFPAPRSVEIPICPGLSYSVAPTGAPGSLSVLYRCYG